VLNNVLSFIEANTIKGDDKKHPASAILKKGSELSYYDVKLKEKGTIISRECIDNCRLPYPDFEKDIRTNIQGINMYSFSPHMDKLVFNKYKEKMYVGLPDGKIKLFYLGRDLHIAHCDFIKWSPNGEGIFLRQLSGTVPVSIKYANINNLSHSFLTDAEAHRFYFDISKDGRYIAYESSYKKSIKNSIDLLDLLTKEEKVLNIISDLNCYFEFTPSGKHLVLTDLDKGLLSKIIPISKNPQTKLPQKIKYLYFNPIDETVFAYTTRDGTIGIGNIK